MRISEIDSKGGSKDLSTADATCLLTSRALGVEKLPAVESVSICARGQLQSIAFDRGGQS